ncbi:MAG: hypothetical protein ACTHU0_39360 [Kofleriaceae bacterium]
MRPASLAALIALGLGAPAATAAPKAKGAGKSPPACGAKALPLVAGNTWTYESVAAPAPLPDHLARLAPPQPKKVVISVASVEAQNGDTVAKLTETVSYDISRDSKTPKLVDNTVESTITCNARGKFDISPESFFFAGEPGGFRGMAIDKLERKKETSWKLTRGTIGENEWIEELQLSWSRQPAKSSDAKPTAGKLEIERKFTPQQPEQVVTKFGSYRAEKLGVTTSGRVTLDTKLAPDGKPCTTKQMDPEKKVEVSVPSEACELPANWISQLWIADEVGVVQALNSYAHMYQLVDAQLK